MQSPLILNCFLSIQNKNFQSVALTAASDALESLVFSEGWDVDLVYGSHCSFREIEQSRGIKCEVTQLIQGVSYPHIAVQYRTVFLLRNCLAWPLLFKDAPLLHYTLTCVHVFLLGLYIQLGNILN